MTTVVPSRPPFRSVLMVRALLVRGRASIPPTQHSPLGGGGYSPHWPRARYFSASGLDYPRGHTSSRSPPVGRSGPFRASRLDSHPVHRSHCFTPWARRSSHAVSTVAPLAPVGPVRPGRPVRPLRACSYRSAFWVQSLQLLHRSAAPSRSRRACFGIGPLVRERPFAPVAHLRSAGRSQLGPGGDVGSVAPVGPGGSFSSTLCRFPSLPVTPFGGGHGRRAHPRQYLRETSSLPVAPGRTSRVPLDPVAIFRPSLHSRSESGPVAPVTPFSPFSRSVRFVPTPPVAPVAPVSGPNAARVSVALDDTAREVSERLALPTGGLRESVEQRGRKRSERQGYT